MGPGVVKSRASVNGGGPVMTRMGSRCRWDMRDEADGGVAGGTGLDSVGPFVGVVGVGASVAVGVGAAVGLRSSAAYLLEKRPEVGDRRDSESVSVSGVGDALIGVESVLAWWYRSFADQRHEDPGEDADRSEAVDEKKAGLA